MEDKGPSSNKAVANNVKRSEDEERVDKILKLDDHEHDLWKYYQSQADHIKDRLWSVGTWLVAMIAAILALPFTARFVAPAENWPPIKVNQAIPTACIAAFGGLFCLYSYNVIKDLQDHIARNWARANYIRDGRYSCTGVSKPGWNILIIMIVLQFLGLAYLFLLSVT